LNAPLRDEEEQRFNNAYGRRKLNHWYRPMETRMSLGQGWHQHGVPRCMKSSDLAGQMSFPLPFDVYQPCFEHYYGEYDHNDDVDYYLLDKDEARLPAHCYFGLWMKDMDEFIPRGGYCTESLENLLDAHRYV
jgi:hypothetical protein